MEFSIVNLLIAFGGGILSFVSPCVLPLIPMYLAYMTGVSVKDLDTDKKPIKKALLNSIFFVIGFTVIFTIFASVFYIIFDNLGGVRIWVDRAVALILIVFALHVMGVITIPFLNYEARMKADAKKDPSIISSFIMGIVFGAGWTPCIGPILSGILMTATDSGNMLGAVIMLIVYSLGLGVPFILTGVATKTLLSLFKSIKKHMKAVEIISGIFLIGIALFIAIPTFLPKAETAVENGKPADAKSAIDFTGVDLMTGKTVKLSDYSGKVVLVNFWATWCDPCRAEIPDLIALQNRYSNDLVIIGISIDNTVDPVVGYVKEAGIQYPVIMQVPGMEKGYGDITGVPTSFIIDRDGNPAKKFVGARSMEQFEELLMPYIKSVTSNIAPQAQAANLAPDFTINNLLNGQNISLSQYKGKVVFVNFWATWCPPCRAEIPAFIRLQSEMKDKFQIIGVSVDTIGAAAVKDFALSMNINYPVGIGDYNLTQQYGGVAAIPTTVIVGTDGTIVGKVVGSKSYEEFKSIVLKYAK